MLQHVGRIPLHQLRADHGGVRAECLVDQRRYGIVAQRHVVVQHEEEPVAAVDQRQHLVDDGTKARVASTVRTRAPGTIARIWSGTSAGDGLVTRATSVRFG